MRKVEPRTVAARIHERALSQSLLDGQTGILTLINEDRPLGEILGEICRVVEAQAQGMMVSILLLDDDRRHLVHGAGPSLPEDYNEAVNGLAIGEGIGSCGTAAVTGQPVIVADIAAHPFWALFRQLAYYKHGLRACWSTPIRAYDGTILGTFSIYYREPKTPSLHERKLIDFTIHLVSIAVNRQRQREQLASDSWP